MKRIAKAIIGIAATIGIVAGCTKVDLDNAGDVNYGAALAVPVGTVHITMGDILNLAKVSAISTDEDCSINLFWQDEPKILRVDLGDYTHGERITGDLNIVNQIPAISAIISALPDGFAIAVPEGSYSFEKDMAYAFGFNAVNDDEERIIRSVEIAKANLDIALNTQGITLNENNYIDVEISFPNIQQQDEVKIFKLHMINSAASLVDTMKQFSISFPTSDTRNEVTMHMKCELVSDGEMTITKQAAMGYDTYFNLMDTKFATGKFWRAAPVYADKLSIAVPANITNADIFKGNNLFVHNPQLKASITNNIGVDITLNLNEISAKGKDGQTRYAMFNGSKKKTIPLSRPMVPQDTAFDMLVFDRENGELHELFKSVPTLVNVDCNVMTGKKGSTYEDFIVNPTEVKLDIQCKLPLWFDAGTEMTYADTIKADFSNLNGEWSDVMSIEQFNVYMDINNGFPFDFRTDISFADENGNIFYTREDVAINSAYTDENGLSIESSNQILTLIFEDADVKEIFKAKKMIIKATIASKEHQMNIRTTDKLDIKVSAFAKVKANIVSLFK
ncbi:MAG: hypothetical protein MJZ93_02725 [Paludibacteraceae bacterium]|nr:hypothetical protein [Paludibacteraceae bacterium]